MSEHKRLGAEEENEELETVEESEEKLLSEDLKGNLESREKVKETKFKTGKGKIGRGNVARYSCTYSTVPNKSRSPPKV
ncbi:MAG: hypothetical protein KJ767_04070 [Nanoarchaeota archaeon]|nr:hypothetical protein [Nanoarchaeota archaeon]